MTTETIIDLDNHLTKCRCCLKEFDDEDIQIKITRIIEERYLNFTELKVNNKHNLGINVWVLCYFQLKLTDSYSHVICESCNNDLRNYALLKKDLVFKQLALIQFVEGDEEIQTEPAEHFEEVPVKAEQESTVDFNNFVNAEYLENIQEIEAEPAGDCDQIFTLNLENLEAEKQQSGGSKTKKMYKRALCGWVWGINENLWLKVLIFWLVF